MRLLELRSCGSPTYFWTALPTCLARDSVASSTAAANSFGGRCVGSNEGRVVVIVAVGI